MGWNLVLIRIDAYGTIGTVLVILNNISYGTIREGGELHESQSDESLKQLGLSQTAAKWKSQHESREKTSEGRIFQQFGTRMSALRGHNARDARPTLRGRHLPRYQHPVRGQCQCRRYGLHAEERSPPPPDYIAKEWRRVPGRTRYDHERRHSAYVFFSTGLLVGGCGPVAAGSRKYDCRLSARLGRLPVSGTAVFRRHAIAARLQPLGHWPRKVVFRL